MRRLFQGVLLASTLGLAAGSSWAQSTLPALKAESPLLDLQGSWRSGRSADLLAILDEHVEWLLRRQPLEATQRGDERFSRVLADDSPEATARRTADLQDRLRRLRSLDVSKFSDQDRLDADLLRYELETDLELAPFHREQLAIDSRSGPQAWLAQMPDRLRIETPKQKEDYAYRLEAIGPHIDQTIAQLRAGLAAGRVQPKIAMAGTVEQCAMLSTDDIAATPSLSPFFKPFRGMPETDPSVIRARHAIKNVIVPAYRRFGAFLKDEYIPKCRETYGYSQGVDGVAAYDAALRSHTTTSMSAEEIHRQGLSEVERIRAEMLDVIARTDFPEKDALKGDTLFNAFVQYLRTDPRFYHKTPEELLTGYREIAKRIDAELPRLFTVLPRLSYGVRELPMLTAPTAPTAYYYRGSLKSGASAWFMANTYKLDQRPKYEMVALTLHEAVPGHHLQIALSQELEGQHPFRTFSDYTAFVEGWALYAERLGLEVGDADMVDRNDASPGEARRHMYSDPYDDFGRLSYEMWRASRLVVDTGIHAKGWSRQQAIDFMLAQTSLSPLNIEREVDRYIAWPGQACAYKIGELKIRELRARAEKALGDRFDKRRFHDAILSSGSIPLPTLEQKIDRWIAVELKSN